MSIEVGIVLTRLQSGFFLGHECDSRGGVGVRRQDKCHETPSIRPGCSAAIVADVTNSILVTEI